MTRRIKKYIYWTCPRECNGDNKECSKDDCRYPLKFSAGYGYVDWWTVENWKKEMQEMETNND